MAQDDESMRVIVIKGGPEIVAQMFGGFVCADGVVQVGKIKINEWEVNPVLALTMAGINDELGALIPDPEKRAARQEQLLNEQEHLPARQQLFGIEVDVFRAMRADMIATEPSQRPIKMSDLILPGV